MSSGAKQTRTRTPEELQITGEILDFNREYDQIINSNFGQIPSQFLSLLDYTVTTDNPVISARSGQVALEAAVKLTDDPIEKVQLLDYAHQSWEATADADIDQDITYLDILTARMNLATFESFAAIALTGGLPEKDTRLAMFRDLVDVARSSLSYSEFLTEMEHDQAASSKIRSLVGFQSELAVMLLHQGVGRAKGDLSQLALPSYYSEDHGLRLHRHKDKFHAWDISVHQTDHGQLSVATKMQIKASTRAMRLAKKTYADDITVVYLNEDIAPPEVGKRHAPSWVLSTLITGEPGVNQATVDESDDNEYAVRQMQDRLTSRIVSANPVLV